MGKRQQQRKLKEFHNNVDKALWFATSFGIIPKSLTFEVAGTNGKTMEHKFNSGEKAKVNTTDNASGASNDGAENGTDDVEDHTVSNPRLERAKQRPI